jgi:hypothetical protein
MRDEEGSPQEEPVHGKPDTHRAPVSFQENRKSEPAQQKSVKYGEGKRRPIQ